MHGERIDAGQIAPGTHATYLLLDRAEGHTAGPWVDVRGARAMSLDVIGLAGGTVSLLATNAVKPADDHVGSPLGEEITRDGLVALSDLAVGALRVIVVDQESPVTVRLHVAW